MNRKLTKVQKKRLSLAYKIITPIAFIGLFFLVWQIICWSGKVPKVFLPTPSDTINAFIKGNKLIMRHTLITLIEAISGLSLGILLGFIIALLMDTFKLFNYGFKPLLLISQTIPTIVIAPLLIMWMGYGIGPKVFIVMLTTFFPIAIGLADGYMSTDKDMIDLMKSMGAGKLKIFYFLKFQNALPNFFSGLKISSTYAIVGAVISEWVGSNEGLGFYIQNAQYHMEFATMFAIIFWIILLSLTLMALVEIIKKLIIPWDKK